MGCCSDSQGTTKAPQHYVVGLLLWMGWVQNTKVPQWKTCVFKGLSGLLALFHEWSLLLAPPRSFSEPTGHQTFSSRLATTPTTCTWSPTAPTWCSWTLTPYAWSTTPSASSTGSWTPSSWSFWRPTSSTWRTASPTSWTLLWSFWLSSLSYWSTKVGP